MTTVKKQVAANSPQTLALFTSKGEPNDLELANGYGTPIGMNIYCILCTRYVTPTISSVLMDSAWLVLAAQQDLDREYSTILPAWNADITKCLLSIIRGTRPLLLSAGCMLARTFFVQTSRRDAYTNGAPAESITESTRFNR
jgi:hypothetical protein